MENSSFRSTKPSTLGLPLTADPENNILDILFSQTNVNNSVIKSNIPSSYKKYNYQFQQL